MHTITQKVRSKVNGYAVDNGSKAGILHIFHMSGKLKDPNQLRSLNLREQEWFKEGFEHYLSHQDHPIRATHSPHHYGRIVYYLSLLYYVSLTLWLGALVNSAISNHIQIRWTNVWAWIAFASAFNVILTFYGIHLELKAYKGQLGRTHRAMAALAIIVLVVAIMGNLVGFEEGSADVITPFMYDL